MHHYACNGHVLNGHVQARQLLPVYHNILRFQFIHVNGYNLFKFIKISLNILIQCHGSYMEMNEFSFMLEIDILRNSSQNFLGVQRGGF